MGAWMPALVAPLLYLLSFDVANFLLAALVDSGEACDPRARVVSLPGALVVAADDWGSGALAKETFVPLSVVFTCGRLVAERWDTTGHP